VRHRRLALLVVVVLLGACSRRERSEADLVCRARELSGQRQGPFSQLARWIDSKLRKEAPVRRIFAAGTNLADELQAYASKLGLASCPLVDELRLAEVRSGRRSLVGPCELDRRRLCKDVPREGGGVLECLERQLSQLSDLCRAVLRRSSRHPCARDAVRFCPEMPPHQIRRCIELHKRELSPGCRSQIAVGQQIFEACKIEIGSICKGDQPTSLDCLRARVGELSDTCKTAVERFQRDYVGD
jgi:hypothetical protein